MRAAESLQGASQSFALPCHGHALLKLPLQRRSDGALLRESGVAYRGRRQSNQRQEETM
jgi:hypothetical protein